MADLLADIDNRFGYHKPLSDEVTAAHETVRSLAGDVAKELVHTALSVAPMSREVSLGLTALEEAAMWFNAHIARNQPVPEAPVVDTEAGTVAPAPEPAPDPVPVPVSTPPIPGPSIKGS